MPVAKPKKRALDVAYSVMDDRPELVLADIDRAESEGSVAKQRTAVAACRHRRSGSADGRPSGSA